MAKVVLIIDSDTGELINVAGSVRESGGRYSKFAKRMLSLDKNPTLDYGFNGGDTLVISKGGVPGALINLKAATVKVSGTLQINDQTLQQLIESGQASTVTAMIKGKQGEIKIESGVDQETQKAILTISLDSTLATKIQELEEYLGSVPELPEKYISKAALADALRGIYLAEDATLEDVKAQFTALVENLQGLAQGAEEAAEPD